MKRTLLLAFFFMGCAQRPIRTYEYCLAKDVTPKTVGTVVYSWVAHCDSGLDVVFSTPISPGNRITYTSYTEGRDTTTLHGYIKRIETKAKP